MHTVFYRKYRPDSFAQLVGQEAVAATLKQALKETCVSHAYLLCGPRGTGKTTIARLIAKGVNCLNLSNEGEPCNQCANCLAIKDNAFPDIIEIDAASNRSIDDIRDLKEKVHFMPLQGKKKVYIIDEVHMLTKEAFNALLKTLEEPPAHVHFILATTERHKVPATIVSRTQNFTLKPLSDDKILGLLRKVTSTENIVAEEDGLKMIAQASEGGLRDALTLLEQCVLNKQITIEHVINQLGFVRTTVIEKFVELWQTADAATKLAYLKDLYNQGVLVDQFVKQATLYLREKLYEKISANKAERDWYVQAIEALMNCERQLNVSPLPILALELAYLSLEGVQNSDIILSQSKDRTQSDSQESKNEKSKAENIIAQATPPIVNLQSSTTPSPNLQPTIAPSQPSPTTPLSALRSPNSLESLIDHDLQAKWQNSIKLLPPTLRLALRSSEIVKENGKLVIYINSQFELIKVNTNAGIQQVRDLLNNQMNETLDVELKVKEDQPQAAEMLTKVQAIFGGQTTPA